MKRKLRRFPLAVGVAVALTAMTGAMAADRILSADEVKKLVSGNTASVTQISSGKKWKIYFAPDGKGYESEGEARGTWEVKDNGEHCTDWAVTKCAKVADTGDGKYARVNAKGERVVIWTIEAGKKL